LEQRPGRLLAHDAIAVVAGVPFGEAGTTNNLRVVQIG
jgi:hypothetical protein